VLLGLAAVALPVEAATAAETNLAGVCPSPLVIQLDWFPQAEHGAAFNLLGDHYEVDKTDMRISGPLVAGGVDTGIKLELRSGGAPVSNMTTNSVAYADSSIHLTLLSMTDLMLGSRAAPMVAVLAPFEKSPIAVMWSPQRYPDVETIKDLKDKGITVNVSPGAAWPNYLVALGQLDASQVDRSFDSSPAPFIASGGEFAQQALATSDPFNYQEVYKEWGKPVKYQLIHDAGFRSYFETLAVRADKLDEMRPCLKRLVPLWQQALVDYMEHPEKANARIVDMVKTIDTYWRHGAERAAYSAKAQRDLGMVANGSTPTIGDFDKDVVDEMLVLLRKSGSQIPEGFVGAKAYTNEFLDPSIGFK